MNETESVRRSIAEHISRYLQESKCSKADFGKKFDVSRTSVDRWISCVCAPDIELIPKISKEINVSVPDLLGIEDVSSSSLTPELTELVKEYLSEENFRNLVKRYRNDDRFRQAVDYIMSLKN